MLVVWPIQGDHVTVLYACEEVGIVSHYTSPISVSWQLMHPLTCKQKTNKYFLNELKDRMCLHILCFH